MTSVWITLIICITFVYLVERQVSEGKKEADRSREKTGLLTVELTQKLEEMETLKGRMEGLLLKNGLGR